MAYSDQNPHPGIGIPSRSGGAPGGSAFVQSIMGLSGQARDARIVAEVLRGNVPDSMHQLAPVDMGRYTIYVTPDYVAVGSEADNVRVPLGLPAAARIAGEAGAILPTRRMVDAIVAQAETRLSPQPMDPTSAMTTTGYFVRQDAMTDAQFSARGGEPGDLTAGHRKDLVLSPRLESNPGRVAIYGWHQNNGRPIQPLSTVHGGEYADYSHGVRLVSRQAYDNATGQWVDLADVLADPALSRHLSDEGPINAAAIMARQSGMGVGTLRARAEAAGTAEAPPSGAPLAAAEPSVPAAPAPVPAAAAPVPASPPAPAAPPAAPASRSVAAAAAPPAAPASPPVAAAADSAASDAGQGPVDMPRLRGRIEAGGLLRRGSRGEEVRELQLFLNEHGYLDAQGGALVTDGVFGPRTEHALRTFQRDQGIRADGVVGPQTMGKVNMTNLMAGLDTNRDAMVSVEEVRAQHAGITVADGAANAELNGVSVPLNTPNPTLNRDAAPTVGS